MASNLFNSAMQAYKDIAERTNNTDMLKMIDKSWNADTQRYEIPDEFEKSSQNNDVIKKKVSENMQNDTIYLGETVSEEKAKEILNNANYDMTDYRDAEFKFGVAKDIGGSNPYTIWIYDTDTFIHCDYEKAVEVLQDLESAIEKDNNEEKEYARDAIPTLWKMFKNGTWIISDFFFDSYKNAFGHHCPRVASQIENEIKTYASELGVPLDEIIKESTENKNLFIKKADYYTDGVYTYFDLDNKEIADIEVLSDASVGIQNIYNKNFYKFFFDSIEEPENVSVKKFEQLLNQFLSSQKQNITESFDDSKKYHVTEYRVTGYQYRWSIINDYTAENGKHYALLENNEWGDEQCYLVVELGTEKMKNYTSHKTGKSFDLPTFDTVLAETSDSLLTALADEDIISYDEAERHMNESVKIQESADKYINDSELAYNNDDRKILKKVGGYTIIKDGYGFGVDDGVRINRFIIDNDGNPLFDYSPIKTVKDAIKMLIKKGVFDNPYYKGDNATYIGNTLKYGRGVEESCKIRKKIKSLEEQLNELRKLLK